MSRKVPEIRFNGFTEDWELRKLGDVANHRGGTAIEKYFDKDGKYKVISIGSYGINSKYVDQNIRALQNEVTKRRIVHKNELAMVLNDKTSNGTIIGRSLLIEADDEYIVNQRTEIVSPKENFDPNFAYAILNGPFREKVRRIAQGGTQIYVNYPAIENSTLLLPKLAEQQEIGAFFRGLDNLITLHQRKLENLKKSKKGFLQKMFPKNGEQVPKIRFDGFVDEWEELKLGDESDVRDGTHDSPKYYNKGYPLVTSKNLKDFGLDLSDVSFISMEDFNAINKRSKVNVGDILFGMIGTIGNPVQVNREDFAIKNVALIKERKRILNSFLIQVLKSPIFDRFIGNENAGGTQKFLSLSTIRNFELLCPNVEEQNRISSFFKKLDTTLILHQRQLENLKKTKQAFLQKMFI